MSVPVNPRHDEAIKPTRRDDKKEDKKSKYYSNSFFFQSKRDEIFELCRNLEQSEIDKQILDPLFAVFESFLGTF